MEQTVKENSITQGVIWKQLLIFFFPILIGTFFQQLYNTVDTIVVGQYVGTSALAAVGTTSTLINLLLGFLWASPLAPRSSSPSFSARETPKTSARRCTPPWPWPWRGASSSWCWGC